MGKIDYCKGRLINVSGLEIIWFLFTTPEFLEQICYDTLFSMKYSFHFLVPVVDYTYL